MDKGTRNYLWPVIPSHRPSPPRVPLAPSCFSFPSSIFDRRVALSNLTQNAEPKEVGMNQKPISSGRGGRERWPPGQTRRLKLSKRRHGNRSEPRGQPSLIATIINADSTPTWTTCETHSPDSKRISSTNLGGTNARETNRGLADERRASVRQPRFLAPRRAAVANEKETDPTPGKKPSERALGRMRTDQAGSLRRHLRPSWSSGR